MEAYSPPLVDFIDWEETTDHTIEVTNETIDYYRYFDGTKQAEFLYDCVKDTLQKIIPDEVNYLWKYDSFKNYLDNTFKMPDKLVALLVRFLEQNNGKLSKRVRENEFKALTDNRAEEIEKSYQDIFNT